MIINFSVSNYKSFRDRKTLSLLASSANDNHESSIINFEYPSAKRAKELKILKSAVIYGANASGKSNLLDAIKFMRNFVLDSSIGIQFKDTINVSSFVLNVETENSPSAFEIVFIQNNTRYRYGFELDKNKVHYEWLFRSNKGRESMLFTREGSDHTISDVFKEGKSLDSKTRENALFLSVVAQFNGEISREIINWFLKLNCITGIDDIEYNNFTLNKLKESEFLKMVGLFAKEADLGINGIYLQETEIPLIDLPNKLSLRSLQSINTRIFKEKINDKKITVNTLYSLHNKYDNNNKEIDKVPFEIKRESQGTQKFIFLAGPILDTLHNGKILIVDELDARLHPLLTQFIIRLFSLKEINKNNAQLIFATHDINLLNKNIFRRDQIWFTEKDKFGATDLFSLYDFKPGIQKARQEAPYNKNYLQGKYGAIPIVGDISSFDGVTNDKE